MYPVEANQSLLKWMRVTNETQKKSEKDAISLLLEALNQPSQKESIQNLDPPEPDVLVCVRNKKIGVEVTRYQKSPKRRGFEVAWEALQRRLHQYFREEKELCLSICLSFKQFKAPNPNKESEIAQFIMQLDNFFQSQGDRLGRCESFDDYPLLSQYLSFIEIVEFLNSNTEWRCSEVTTGGVGMAEHELLGVLKNKKDKPENCQETYDKKWLLIIGGDGDNISAQLGRSFSILCPQWSELNSYIQDMPFDSIFIFNTHWGYPLCEWNKEAGWREIIDIQGNRIQS